MHAPIVQHHTTNIKWYAETLLEENPGMSIEDAMAIAAARYSYPALPANYKAAVKRCAASLEYKDLSFKTKKIRAEQDLKVCRGWFERLCVWLNPYLN